MARRPAKTLSAPEGEEYTPIFDEGETSVTTSDVEAVPDVIEAVPESGGGDDWDSLLGMVETDTVAVKAAVVEPPSGVVKLLESLSVPGEDGGKRRAKLPVKSMAHYDEVRLTLRRASRRMAEPKTVSTKPVFASEDLEPYESENGRKMTRPKEGAVPTHIAFTVGEKRTRESVSDSSE